MGDNENSRDDRDKKAQNQDESTLGKKSKNRLAADARSKKRKEKETRLPRTYVKEFFFTSSGCRSYVSMLSHQS